MRRFPNQRHRRALPALALCLALLLGGCETRVEPAESERTPQEVSRIDSVGEEAPTGAADAAAEPGDNSFEAVTAHIDFALPGELIIARPAKDITLDAASYYITGVADPEQELLLNGEPVEARGGQGTFGVFVELEPGENVFTFSQGDEHAAVVLTRETATGYAVTDSATRMRPEIDAAARSGSEYLLSCVAPSGGTVTAALGDEVYPLEQSAATAVEGVPATFTTTISLPEVEGTAELGPVVYTLTYGGETGEYPSEGILYVAGSGAALVVRGKDIASTVFAESSTESAFATVLPQNAVDVVTEIGSSMYRLGMGGWVLKDAVTPQTAPTVYQNQVSDTGYNVGETYEALSLRGVATPPYRASWGAEGYTLTLFHTSGAKAPDVSGSALLAGIDIAESKDGDTTDTTLTFRPKGDVLGGYLVEYDGDVTTIYLKAPPAPAEGGDAPLSGLIILLDAGHGGIDTGATGIVGDHGPLEKDITLAATLAVGQYLRGMGATVRYTRTDDDRRVDLNERLALIRDPEVDFAISLHCNSVSTSLDGSGPSGVETFYHHAASQPFAKALNDAICAKTGRKDRGAKPGYFKVTLNSGAPSVLVEMGFLTNPMEYDGLYSKEGVYDLAQAIGQGIQTYLGQT